MLQLFCKCCQNEFDVVILSGDVKGWNKYLLFVNNLSKMFINHLQQNSKMFKLILSHKMFDWFYLEEC